MNSVDNIGNLQFNIVTTLHYKVIRRMQSMIPSQMLKGVLEGCILKIIEQQETYAYVISKELAKCGFGEISEGTIYPVILRLQKKELINYTLGESETGPVRKYYRLTEKGICELSEFKKNWNGLSEAVNQLFMEE